MHADWATWNACLGWARSFWRQWEHSLVRETYRERERERGREIQERIFMLIRRIIGWGRTEFLGLFLTSANKRLKPQTCCSYSTPFRSGFSTTKCNFAAFLGIFFFYTFASVYIFYYLSYILPQFPWSLRKTLVAHCFSFLFPPFPVYVGVCVCVISTWLMGA